jgi:hypothetical protein
MLRSRFCPTNRNEKSIRIISGSSPIYGIYPHAPGLAIFLRWTVLCGLLTYTMHMVGNSKQLAPNPSGIPMPPGPLDCPLEQILPLLLTDQSAAEQQRLL